MKVTQHTYNEKSEVNYIQLVHSFTMTCEPGLTGISGDLASICNNVVIDVIRGIMCAVVNFWGGYIKLSCNITCILRVHAISLNTEQP